MKRIALALIVTTAACPVFAHEGAAFGALARLSGGLVGPSFAPVARVILAAPAAGQASSAWTNAVDFQCVASSQDAQATADCLKKSGITVSDYTPGSKVAVVDNKDVYEGSAAAPAGGRMLMQINKNGPVTYTLKFAPALAALVFTRPKLTVSKDKDGKTSGITHPKWSAHAFDAAGTEIATVGEDLIGSYEDVPAKSFALKGPGIASVRFDSDGRNFTAFSAVLIEKLEPQR